MALGLWALALGAAVIAAAASPAVTALGMTICGAGFGMFVPAAQTFVSAVGGSAFMGVTVGIWIAINRLSQSVVPPVASFGSESIGSRTTSQIGAIVMLVLALTWRSARRGLN